MSLKENVAVIGNIGGADVISWDWNSKAYEHLGLEGSSIGFNASNIQDTHPHHVTTNKDGLLMIDYDELLLELTNGDH